MRTKSIFLYMTFAVALSGCATKEGKQAHADSVAIQHNDATAQTATEQAQTANDAARVSNQTTGQHLSEAQELLRRISNKDRVISQEEQ